MVGESLVRLGLLCNIECLIIFFIVLKDFVNFNVLLWIGMRWLGLFLKNVIGLFVSLDGNSFLVILIVCVRNF